MPEHMKSRLKKTPMVILYEYSRTKDNEVIIHDSITARSHFFISNGTFMINNTERTDLAEYVIVTFDKNGKSLGTRGLQLLIEGKCLTL
jgi:hypothetical protein